MANTKTTTAAKEVKPVATEVKAVVADTKAAATTVEATKKEAAPKKDAAKKEATKKEAPKKEAPKKEAAKKATTTKKTTTKKAEIKTNVLLQFAYKEVSYDDIVANVKKAWTAQKGKLKDIKTLDIYVKPEEHKAYFVVNGEVENTHSIDL